jgi:PhnB protein
MATVPQEVGPTFFAPHLTLRNVLAGIEFYQSAFGAVELRRWSNADGSVHVAEMAIEGALFHLHEEVPASGEFSPESLNGTTALVGLFVPDPQATMKRAVAAGGRQASTVRDYDYGYRQGVVVDPAGHRWLLERKI